MNYLELINQYWDLREQGILSATEGDYYLFLVHKCNRLSWKNPFNLSNQLCCGYLGIQEKSLIKYRNKLKQIGLISFKSGTKGSNTEYILNLTCKNYSESGSESGSLSGSESGSLSGEKSPDNIKQKQNQKKTKLSKSHLPPSGGAHEKNETQYWAELCNCWFEFYETKFSTAPSFDGVKGKALKSICVRLQKSAEQKAKGHKTPEVFEWTEKYAVHALKYFFQRAWEHDPWLQINFELPVLSQKFDSITNSKENQHGTNRQHSNQIFSGTDYTKF